MEKKRVLAFGTFDLLHAGHRHFLKKARELGTELFVVVARDATVKRIKGKKPVFPEKKRLQLVSGLSFVSHCQLGNNYFTERYRCVQEINPDIIALGYDQKPGEAELKKQLEKKGWHGRITRIDAKEGGVLKTTKLREMLGI